MADNCECWYMKSRQISQFCFVVTHHAEYVMAYHAEYVILFPLLGPLLLFFLQKLMANCSQSMPEVRLCKHSR